MTRVRILLLSIAIALSAACSSGGESSENVSASEAPPVSDRPVNVVLIVSDALRQDVLGCYGGTARTPNIDWLAEHGALFENAYANSNWTAPSSVTLLTGNYPTAYGHSREAGTFRLHVPDRDVLFCEVLQQMGYTVAGMVENIHAVLHNNMQGVYALPHGSKFRNVTSEATRRQIAEIAGHNLNYEPYWHLGVLLTALLERPAGKPFFTLFWMLDPHEPYRPVDRIGNKVRERAAALPQNPAYYERAKLPMERLSDAEADYVKRLYIAEVESVDERVGFLIDGLRQQDLLESTCIIFTADHGEMFGEQSKWGHHAYFYDSLMRIPLIVAGPGVARGIRPLDRVSVVDIVPTLRDLLGVEYEHAMQGRSFLPLLSGGHRENDSVYITNIRRRKKANALMHQDALIEGEYKLITLEDGSFELYNLLEDPEESHDIASERSQVVERMFDRIKAWREENELLKARNTSVVADTTRRLTDEELEETKKKLKALGYIN